MIFAFAFPSRVMRKINGALAIVVFCNSSPGVARKPRAVTPESEKICKRIAGGVEFALVHRSVRMIFCYAPRYGSGC